jgi:glucosamine--fructose-6-phosphate aminotransferase (isomerizing)
MYPDFSIIEGRYLQDILSQPQALDETLAHLDESKALKEIAAAVKKGKFRRILLTGMGSSFHGLYPLSLDLVGEGLTAFMVETSELVHYKDRFLDPHTLVVAVSQSGQSAEVIRLLEINRGRSTLIAVTNTEDSPLARRADALVLTKAGEEFSVSCKTYVSGLMALTWVGNALCHRDPRSTSKELNQAAPAVSAYLSQWQNYVRNLVAELKDIGHLFLVGRGASLAAARAGALIVKESDRFHAEAMSSAAFRHGPFEMLSKETFVLIFSGDVRTQALNRKLFEDIREQQSWAELVGDGASFPAFQLPPVPASVRPIVEILPVQMITLALAAQARREPGRFELTTKVTTTE